MAGPKEMAKPNRDNPDSVANSVERIAYIDNQILHDYMKNPKSAEQIAETLRNNDRATPHKWAFTLIQQTKGRDYESHRLTFMQAACLLDPEDSFFARDLGILLKRAGNYAESEKSLQNFLKIHPGDIFIKMALGSIYIEEREYKKATDILKGIDDVMGRTLRARAFTLLGDYKSASDLLKDASDASGAYGLAVVLLNIYLSQPDNKELSQILGVLDSVRPGDVTEQIRWIRVVSHALLEHLDDSVNQLIPLLLTGTSAYYLRSFIYLREKSTELSGPIRKDMYEHVKQSVIQKQGEAFWRKIEIDAKSFSWLNEARVIVSGVAAR